MVGDDWEKTKEMLAVGARVRCRVTEHRPYGVIVAIPDVPFEGLVQITDFSDVGGMSSRDYPPLGQELEAVVLGFKERGRQIWLGVKPSQIAKSSGGGIDRGRRHLVPLGVRLGPGAQLEFFGVDEINRHLARGGVVIAIERGKAIMTKVGDADGVVNLRIGGFSVDVVVEYP